MASEQLEKYCAQSIDVCHTADSRVVSQCLLWRHVAGRAQYFESARDSALSFNQSREPEVGQMRFAFLIEKNVSRFDVAVKDAVLVCVVNGARYFGDQFDSAPDRH